jgi:hypothetical protein
VETQKNQDQVADALRELQRQVRENAPISPEESAMTFSIDEDLSRPGAVTLLLGPGEVEALRTARAAIEFDPRFEHLGARVADPLRGQLNRFVSLCAVEPDQDHVNPFLLKNRREPEERTCFLGVEFLQIEEPFELFGLRLLPIDHGEIPQSMGRFSTEPPVGSVIAVEVTGTHLTRMKDRAVVIAERALRTLRVALRGKRAINPLQLRFRLPESYSFGSHLVGWQTSPDSRWAFQLDGGLLEAAAGDPIAKLADEPRTNLERHAGLALSWIEDAIMEGDSLKSLLFSFFALEAMLGDRSEGLKAHGLAYRRALLSHATRGSFPDPDQVYLLYDKVRSAAVHGEQPPPVAERDHGAFLWDVREALGEYLELAAQEGFETRRRLLAYLKDLPERGQLDDWLAEFGDDGWARFLPAEDF